MKMLVLACLGATAAAIPFQQSSSSTAQTMREFDALLAQQSNHDLVPEAYAMAQSDQTAAELALRIAEVGHYAAAHSAYQRAAQSAQSNTDLRARQADLERQIEDLRLKWRKLERSRELLDARAELETLEARQKLRMVQRERMRSLEVKCNDLEAEAHAVDQLAEEVSADLERHLVEQLTSAESERSQVIEDRGAELLDRLVARQAAGDETILALKDQLDQAVAKEDAAKVLVLERTIDAMSTKLQDEMNRGELEAQLMIEQSEAKLEADLRSRQSDFEREIRHQRAQRGLHVRQIEMQRRVLESRQAELDEENNFAEERLVLEQDLARRERELAMATELEHMEMLMERLERELERAEDRADEGEACEDEDDDGDDGDDGDDYRLVRDSYAVNQAHIAGQNDQRFELVLEAIAGLRSDVDGLRRDVDKLMKRAESVR